MALEKVNATCYSDKLHKNSQIIDNRFLCVYINNFVKKLRIYNNDKFLICISGLKRLINEDDKILKYLFDQLNENNFTIELEGNQQHISYADITCRNVTKNTSY